MPRKLDRLKHLLVGSGNVDTGKATVRLLSVAAVLLLFAVIATGCGGEPEVATSAGAPTREATPTQAPTATSTVAATPSPAATFTAIPSPTPSPVPTADLRSPLTGLPVGDPALLQMQPMAVQIDNAPAARPQTGLSQASLVYEAQAEGGITRYTAFYLDNSPEIIGPVRSARLIDLEIVPEYQGLLTHFGASSGVIQKLYDLPVLELDLAADYSIGYYWRSPDRPAPNNAFVRLADLRQLAEQNGIIRAVKVPSLYFRSLGEMPFDSVTKASRVTTVGIPYGSACDVRYMYDAQSNSYRRYVEGVPAVDVADGQQIAPKNVIVQFANVIQTGIIEDVNGSHSLEYELQGEGEAIIFRDGLQIEAKWSRHSLNEVTSYYDSSGNRIGLSPGTTWIQIVPVGWSIEAGGS